jgi:hypothetical protein
MIAPAIRSDRESRIRWWSLSMVPPAPQFCRRCGRQAIPDASFCAGCGAPLTVAGPTPPTSFVSASLVAPSSPAAAESPATRPGWWQPSDAHEGRHRCRHRDRGPLDGVRHRIAERASYRRHRLIHLFRLALRVFGGCLLSGIGGDDSLALGDDDDPDEKIAAASIPDFGPGSFPASDRVTVTLFDVAGTSPATIHASIEQGGPWSDWLQGNAQAHVVTSLTYNFHFEDWGDGGCVVVAETASPVSFQYEVRLPRWVDAESASRSTVDWWLETIHETVWHEGHHIELYESVLPAMNEAVLTGSCGSVTADLQSLIYGANRANCEFDLAEYGYQHGLTLESCLSS